MATKINGIQIPQSFGASLGGSPEDAAKAFMRLASKSMADVMKEALVSSIGDAVGAGPTPDWTKLVRGCVMQLDWETPPGTQVQTATAFSSSGANALGSVEVSIGIKASF